MNDRTIFHVLFAVTVLTFPSPVNGLFLQCLFGERCGLFAHVVHTGTPGTDTCEELCVYFSIGSIYQCGGCDVGTADLPTPSPTDPGPTPPLNSQYEIALSLVGIPDSDVSIFTDAVERWESVIVGDVPSIASSGGRFSSGCSPPSTIDDSYICARYVNIDGPGRVLGSAGPTYVRGSGLTIAGEMQFDSADVESLINEGNFDSVILHEMGHILGLGTLWPVGRFNCPYRGPRANDEFRKISGCSVVPTEKDGGPGTRCGHWDEECLGNELMTGFAERGNSPLSRITIAGLEDIGYDVDYRNAESFTRNDLNSNCVCRRRRRTLIDMIHGETHQLGLRLPNAHRRELSGELLEVAMTYGKALLAKRKNSFASILGNLIDKNNSASFVPTDVVSVFVMEDGKFYDVVVRPED